MTFVNSFFLLGGMQSEEMMVDIICVLHECGWDLADLPYDWDREGDCDGEFGG